ncbi:phosphonate C-P lyase system protein PhnG [Paenibacillus aceris]|uniref:Alpha-D-ribose 1-methylphosphonate 5-triphosphate synthase subunit PhnG n=1 Tax=Paenibacillus aceris TaxID=869555 RepID=A0ABS4I9I5_9BACL|nr:phosphonate C-P lyase system protein PhnG [Paenibacillus aceris]MBP1967523.1 alpha-D-ribose 1-methylphosphonate 5-triphosphate synthase subunit PhnG [Paenibacillus aceris]NHW35137.1 phosphonate C-P lyase system protein PhnG [Paenibacillus aceris]
MKRKQRTEMLINGSPQLAADLANEIKGRYSVAVMEEPNYGLVMVKVRETAQKSLFYLGEVLVTECKVQVEGAVGIGIVKGDEPEKAYDLAVIDAAYAARLEETEAWTTLLQSESERLAAKRQDHQSSVLRTKVDFETMDID